MRDRPYQNLIVWKEAHQLCLSVYKAVALLPKHEMFALASQMRRASYSVPMNLVEGNAKISLKEQLHFFEYSESSLEELHYQVMLARDLSYFSQPMVTALVDRIERVGSLLYKLKIALRKRVNVQH